MKITNLSYTVNYCAYLIRLTLRRKIACTKRFYVRVSNLSKDTYGQDNESLKTLVKNENSFRSHILSVKVCVMPLIHAQFRQLITYCNLKGGNPKGIACLKQMEFGIS
jgi:hypothetical protein